MEVSQAEVGRLPKEKVINLRISGTVSIWIMVTVMVDPLQPNTLLHTLKKKVINFRVRLWVRVWIRVIVIVCRPIPTQYFIVYNVFTTTITGYNVRNGC
jgi:hypothetical protein